MQIILIIVCCAMCGLMSGAFMGYKSYNKRYADGKAEAHVLSWGGGNEN